MRLPPDTNGLPLDEREAYLYDTLELFNRDKRSQNAYQYLNRISTIVRLVKDAIGETGDHTVLDVGCAQGNFSLVLGNKYDVIGVDVKASYLRYAKTKRESERVDFVLGSGQDLGFRNKSFDCVICVEVIEHIPNPERLIRQIHRVLKDSGTFICSTPNVLSPVNLFLTPIPGFGRFNKMTENDRQLTFWEKQGRLHTGHVYGFREYELTTLLERCGFQIIQRRRINSLVLGQAIRSIKLSGRSPSRFIWLPKLMPFVATQVFAKIEEKMNASFAGEILGRDLVTLSRKT